MMQQEKHRIEKGEMIVEKIRTGICKLILIFILIL
jgi:hypothetical protein